MSKKPTYAQLERQLFELRAQTGIALRSARTALDRAGSERQTASAVIITISELGGRLITDPFAITDGLSHDTIEALRRDITRTLVLGGDTRESKTTTGGGTPCAK